MYPLLPVRLETDISVTSGTSKNICIRYFRYVLKQIYPLLPRKIFVSFSTSRSVSILPTNISIYPFFP